MPDDARPLCAGLLSSQSRLLDLVLQSVDLSWCSLDHLFGATPGGCLRRLLLARCRIKGTVPETVAGLRGLVVLDVERNRLEGALPLAALDGLPKLAHVYAAGNKFDLAGDERLTRARLVLADDERKVVAARSTRPRLRRQASSSRRQPRSAAAVLGEGKPRAATSLATLARSAATSSAARAPVRERKPRKRAPRRTEAPADGRASASAPRGRDRSPRGRDAADRRSASRGDDATAASGAGAADATVATGGDADAADDDVAGMVERNLERVSGTRGAADDAGDESGGDDDENDDEGAGDDDDDGSGSDHEDVADSEPEDDEGDQPFLLS